MLFLLIFVIGLSSGQVNVPHGHELKVIVDARFNRLDHNPKDGIVEESEWDVIIGLDDSNNDSCVSFTEFMTAHPQITHEIVDKMFHFHDHDHDGCYSVTDVKSEFHLVDHNHDNRVSLHEWDQYFTHLITKLFGHSTGHGHNV